LQELPRLPVGNLTAPDDHATLAVEVEEYRIKNGVLDLFLLMPPRIGAKV
jgi:hypothetical protein